jgi:ADP-dependent phosphofructokinase/glucokinase
MTYRDRYAEYLQQLPQDANHLRSSQKRVVLGYTSDLDVVLEWNSEVFSNIISTHLHEEPSYRIGDVIDSMESFARIVSYHMIHGLGGEADITNNDICAYLENKFHTEYALGGTCAQGAAALNAAGFPVLAHITDRSSEVCRLMSGSGLDTVTAQGVVPMMQSATNDLPVRHMILQYPKGASVSVDGKTYKAPQSNRLILDYDTIHKSMPVDPLFYDFCEAQADNILVYCISGLNAIVDERIMADKIDELIKHFQAIKHVNANCMVYLEGACYLNPDLKNLVFDRLSSVVDFYGMNEEELVDHACRFGLETDKEDLRSVLKALRLLLEKYPVRGIVMHTKDYAMYFGQEIPHADIEKGLTVGNLMAATRARTGHYGTYEECRDTMNLALSAEGIRFADELAQIEHTEHVCIVPSRYMEHPKYTIGLGDTFMAGCLTAFIR